MPVETAKCWWLLKIEPNAWAGGKGSCAVCIDLQAVGALEFFGELYSLAKGFGPFLRGVWAGIREREGSIFSNHQHFAVLQAYAELHALFSEGVYKPLSVSERIAMNFHYFGYAESGEFFFSGGKLKARAITIRLAGERVSKKRELNAWSHARTKEACIHFCCPLFFPVTWFVKYECSLPTGL